VTAPPSRLLRGYMARHRNPWNRALHLAGIPIAPVGSAYLLARGRPREAGRALAAGYALQWLGHRIEGNEVGEWMLLKRIWGRLAR
jgi:hypothetical protein